MKRNAVLTLVLTASLASSALGQSYTFTASALGGVGGGFDAEPDPGFGNASFQLGFSWVSAQQTHVGLRLGRVDFGQEALGTFVAPDLTYVSAAGEYRFRESYYESGIFLGAGYYSLDGTGVSDDAVGILLGVSGDFMLTRRFSLLIEIAGHFTDLSETETFATAHAGLAYHF